MLADLMGALRADTPGRDSEPSTRLFDGFSASLKRDGSDVQSPGSFVRVSSLASLCPRQIRLARDNGLLSGELSANNLYVLGMGTAVHHHMQNGWMQSLLRADGKTVLNGWWKCRKCGCLNTGVRNDGRHGESMMPTDLEPWSDNMAHWPSDHPMTHALPYGWIPRPDSCGKCSALTSDFDVVGGSPLFEYFELSLCSAQHRLVGHSDGVLVWDDGTEELLEVKTINGFGFEKVRAESGGKPKDDHVLQSTAYMGMTGIRRNRIVYMLKSDKQAWRDAMTEHEVEFDMQMYQHVLDIARSALEAIDDVSEDAPVPDRLDACTSKSVGPARYCSCRNPCFKKR